MTGKKKSVSARHNADQENEAVEIQITDTEQENDHKASGAAETEAAASGFDGSGELQALVKEKNDTYDRLLRTMAEFDNYKKRVAREKEGLISYGTEKLAREKDLLTARLEIIKSWFRDLIINPYDDAKIINQDVADQIKVTSGQTDTLVHLSKLDAVQKMQSRLKANTNLRLSMEKLLIQLAQQ